MSSPTPESINNIELRVLQGPQAGAVLPLTGEDIVIGSDRQCDVILQSPAIALRHAQLSVTDNDFSAIALDGQIIASAGVPSAPPWQFGTAIYLGDVAITIDRNTAEWSAVLPPQTITDDQNKSKSTTRWQTDLIVQWKRFALLAAILVSLSIAAQLLKPNRHQTTVQYNLSPANINSINALIANPGRNGLLKLDVSGTKATVHGFLPSKIQINALHRDLSKWRTNLDIDVQAEDTLLAASRHFLIQEHSPLKVTIVDGQAQLSGLDTRRADVNRLAQDLKKNVSGLAGVNATFVDRERLEG
jgi:type III secretion system YscD/HrpQ family protein